MEKNYRVPQTLKIRNGYRTATTNAKGIGGFSVTGSVRYTDLLSETTYFDPKFTYTVLNRPPPTPFEPQFVKYDKQCLVFLGTFLETVAIYPEEMNKSRRVKIFYFLEDDTMAVNEEQGVQDSGKVVRRKRHLKSPEAYYNWKDLNIGREIKLNGIKFHIFGCDPFTKDFMISKGMEVEEEDISKFIAPPVIASTSPSRSAEDRGNFKVDKLRRFLDYHGKILSFDCQMENKDCFQKEWLSFKLYYYLEDDAITIKELKENQEGRHQFSFYLRRTRVPKESSSQPSSYLGVRDLRVGEIIGVFGTRFLLLDCDTFTRDYFARVLKEQQPPKLNVNPVQVEKQTRQPIPKYLGLGTPEDSLSSTFSLRPRTPKRSSGSDEILVYQCQLDNDQDRRFILKFSVRAGTMTIIELPNSGIVAGRFVTSQRVCKPKCDPDLPVYYGPSDLVVGKVILVNCNRFRITGADTSVYQFMLKHPELFTADQMEKLRLVAQDRNNTTDN